MIIVHEACLRLWSCALNDVSRYKVHWPIQEQQYLQNFDVGISDKLWTSLLCLFTSDIYVDKYHFKLEEAFLHCLPSGWFFCLSWCIETPGFFYRHLFKCSLGVVYGAFLQQLPESYQSRFSLRVSSSIAKSSGSFF